MSIRRAKLRSPAPTATILSPGCAHGATAMCSRSMPRSNSRRSCATSRGPATMSCSWEPAASPNGPMHCPASLRRSGLRREGMSFIDLVPDLRGRLPDLRGRLIANQPLAELTWFRVGGPAQALFMPEDEQDLAYFLAHLPPEIPVTVIGLGSNLIVRDGGVPGVVVRLGRGFGEVKVEPGARVRAGTAVPDVKVSRAAQEAAIAGLAFFRGIPGAIG